ncbi:MAG TPA: glutamine amidotransferase, partial [Actinomycetota bacterium]|nr:glutamine amidotransferase [Actinomycetota bacterium]
MAEHLRIGLVYPELLGTYGDRGNAEVLAWRAVRRGVAADVVEVRAPAPIPADLDVYLLGGGEDAAQATAADLLRSAAGDGLRQAVLEGRPVLAICGALQLLGRTYADGAGRRTEGLGLVDLHTQSGVPRLVGEVVIRTREGELLTGFENHGGRTRLGRGVEPLGTVVLGAGNNGADGTEGIRQGALVGTYLHGPVLARNPFLADMLLGWVLSRRGVDPGTLRPLGPDPSGRLHDARLRA